MESDSGEEDNRHLRLDNAWSLGGGSSYSMFPTSRSLTQIELPAEPVNYDGK